MKIRTLLTNDLDSLLSLYRHLHDADLPLPAPKIVASVWEEILANPNNPYFGGFVDGQLVTSCTLTITPNLTRGCAPYGLIENVVTHAAHRNRGYGKAILVYALDKAWSAGCYKVMLLTGRKDQATLDFYKSAGFASHEKQAFVAKPPI